MSTMQQHSKQVMQVEKYASMPGPNLEVFLRTLEQHGIVNVPRLNTR